MSPAPKKATITHGPGQQAPSAKADAAKQAGPAKVAQLDPDELAALEEQRDFLLASLADLDREHDAGDLEDDDYQTLKDDYTARAADVLRAIADRRAAFADARRPRSLGRTMLVVAGVALFALVAGIAVAKAMGARKAGDTITGGISVEQSPSQQANDCSTKINTDPTGASKCFEEVLQKDPQNAVALTWSAWLLSLVAPSAQEPQRTVLQAKAAVRLDQAIESDPSYSYARAFRAVVAYRNGHDADAQKYLQDFKDHDPSAEAAQVLKQMDLEGLIAKALANPTSTTSTSTPTSTTVPD